MFWLLILNFLCFDCWNLIVEFIQIKSPIRNVCLLQKEEHLGRKYLKKLIREIFVNLLWLFLSGYALLHGLYALYYVRVIQNWNNDLLNFDIQLDALAAPFWRKAWKIKRNQIHKFLYAHGEHSNAIIACCYTFFRCLLLYLSLALTFFVLFYEIFTFCFETLEPLNGEV